MAGSARVRLQAGHLRLEVPPAVADAEGGAPVRRMAARMRSAIAAARMRCAIADSRIRCAIVDSRVRCAVADSRIRRVVAAGLIVLALPMAAEAASHRI